MTKKTRLLIIEDLSSDVELIRRELRTLGQPFEIRVVQDEAGLRRELAAFKPDVVLSDYMLPRFNGMAALKVVQSVDPDLPFIVVTGSMNELVAVECMRAGAWDYVIKEKLDRLVPSIHFALQKKGLDEDKKRVRQALEESEERYRYLFEHSPIPLWEEDFSALVAFLEKLFDDGVKREDLGAYFEGHPEALLECARLVKVADVNQATVSLYGAESKEELLGALDKIFTEKSLEVFKEEALALAAGKERFETEIQQKTLQGDLIDIYLGLSVRKKTDYRQVLVATTDISSIKRAEKEREHLMSQISDQARQMQEILDTVPDGIFLMDAHCRVLAANPVARTLLTDLADASEGQVISRLGNRPLNELLGVPTKDLRHEIASGGRFFEVVARPTGESDHPQGWVIVIRDVTNMRETQKRLQLQERLAAVGQLAAGIAHDFNNILGVILLYTQMEENTQNLPSSTRKRLKTIARQADRASKLVEQILDFSRRSLLERYPLDLKSFLKEEIKLLKRTFPENIKIMLDCAPDACMINADPTRLQQAILNLMVNARDVLPNGGTLRVDLDVFHFSDTREAPLPEMAPGEWNRLTIADDGPGIPFEIQSRIFDPFFTTKAPGRGTGLGLSQVYGIVKQHRGYISVESKKGKGTTFTIYFPALSVQKVEQPPAEVSDTPKGNGEVILMVEDNENLLEVMKEILELSNYRVLSAVNGQDALEVLERNQRGLSEEKPGIALVISDLVMPVMGGRELFQAVTKQYPSIRMILMSGYPLNQSLEDVNREDLAGFLQKPVNTEKLCKAVARALGKG